MNFSCSKQIFWTSYAYMYTGGVVTRALSIPLIVSVSYDCINPTTELVSQLHFLQILL